MINVIQSFIQVMVLLVSMIFGKRGKKVKVHVVNIFQRFLIVFFSPITAVELFLLVSIHTLMGVTIEGVWV